MSTQETVTENQDHAIKMAETFAIPLKVESKKVEVCLITKQDSIEQKILETFKNMLLIDETIDELDNSVEENMIKEDIKIIKENSNWLISFIITEGSVFLYTKQRSPVNTCSTKTYDELSAKEQMFHHSHAIRSELWNTLNRLFSCSKIVCLADYKKRLFHSHTFANTTAFSSPMITVNNESIKWMVIVDFTKLDLWIPNSVASFDEQLKDIVNKTQERIMRSNRNSWLSDLELREELNKEVSKIIGWTLSDEFIWKVKLGK